MSLPEQYRPRTRAELVGNKKAITKLEDCILSSRVSLIDGSAGIGKTTSVFVIANQIGFKVREWNASDSRRKDDFQNIIRETRNHAFVPTIFLLDEIDGIEDFKSLEECVKNTRNILVLICNDAYKIPQKIKELCEQIHFYPPYTSEVAEVIKRISQASGKKADFSHINGDVRSSILKAFYGSEKYSSQTVFDEVQDFFGKGVIEPLNPDHYVWLIDNAPKQLRGRKLFEFQQLLGVCDKLNNFSPLTALSFRSSIKIEYPRYIKRAKMLKGKTNVK